MRNRGVGSWPARRARMSPHRVALVHVRREWTFADVSGRSTRLAYVLRERGVRAGDRVAFLGPNRPEFLETMFAAGLLGAVFVPLNTRLAVPELATIVADCGATALVHSSEHADAAAALGVADPIAAPYEAVLAAAPTAPLDEPVDPADPCLLLYTSGTTGRPKGVVLTHANLAWNAFNLLLDVDLTADEVALVSAPMFHVAALNQTVLPTFLKGGRSVLVPRFDPAGSLRLIATHGVTLMFGVPAMFQTIAACDEWAGADLSTVRTLMCGGAPVPESLIATYHRRGLTFLQGYGMTEAAPGVLFLRAEESRRRAGSAGTAVFFGDVRVVRPDGTDVAPDEPGEILVRGPNVSPGYWNRPDDTAAAFDGDGWFHSGDVAVVDGDGFAHVRDRIKDMIISGGENIYPAEVEDALSGHPDVAECAVIGVPDDRWGEVGRAVVVPRTGSTVDPAQVLAFLDGRIARYKIPKSVVLTETLPRTASGKVLKSRLRTTHGEETT
ncbi:acyl-CoA synthetase [Virgisporangium ochraceum]|uniref:Fatty-acyl-CoA synthase n=1 Tax=Virgisporangium ochraceum TaxID=65505 RepID=A0A8J4EI76_9ACTN|nr:long-chain fatty acid--CoA ligase [Virgisporangium ochraceum]GIJ72972.1 fatty-acyl-CoA synthase [Virgisporangium ochraceum]